MAVSESLNPSPRLIFPDGLTTTQELPVPLVTLYLIVHGPIYERYAQVLLEDIDRNWFPNDRTEVVVLPGNGGWPHGSASRYQVALDNEDRLRGEWIFQIDADMRIYGHVGREILSGSTIGLTVTTHPGFPPDADPNTAPFERRPESRAYVPLGSGGTYHPGAFVGGTREAFLRMCETTMAWYADDLERGIEAAWYEESYLNKYLIGTPPALVLDGRYCGWGADAPGAIITHLNKTTEEFQNRG